MQKQSFNRCWTCNGMPVTLPHDAQITEKRGADVGGSGHGYFPGGVYTYEKTFTAPAEWADKTILLEFEGVCKNATVSLNGKELCFHAYGYTRFFVELKELNIGGENTVTVVADNSKLPNSRWYSGSGIYRPVWLYVGPKESIRPESVKLSTVSIDPAVVRVQSPIPVKVELAGVCGEGTGFTLTIPDAKLWSAEEPHLYTAKITSAEDETVIPFGIRQIMVIEQAPPLVERLQALSVPVEYHYYGDKEHVLGHVFHCNIRSADAQQCNTDECNFFKRFL